MNRSAWSNPLRYLLWLGKRFDGRALLLCPLLAVAGVGHAGTLAQFRSPFGDIEVELYDQDKPVTVGNFVHYIKAGAYEDGFAHRLLPGFVVQGGGFTVTNRGTTNWLVEPVPSYQAIANEFGVGRRFSNTFGTIAMAKVGGDTNSATSQWFINLANNAFLDAADSNNFFVVFGHVIKGSNVLNVLNGFQYYSGTQKTNLVLNGFYQPPFDDLPLLYADPNADTNLLFFDITLLQLDVTLAVNGGQRISWNSPAGLTNFVEYTTNLPPVWRTLTQTNGTGQRIAIIDPVQNASRFYRVRVAY